MHLFEVMWRELQRRDIELHVEFLTRAATHRPKSWQADSSSIQFPHSFSTDIGPRYKGVKWHFNPAINAKLAVKKYDYLLVGGPWATITAGLGTVFNRADRTIAWIEGTSSHTNSFSGKKRRIKRYLLNKYDYVAVPGEEGTKFIHRILDPTGPNSPEIVALPNIVSEAKFNPGPVDGEQRAWLRQKLGIPPESRIAIWPARHVAEGYVDKGVPEFLLNLNPDKFGDWKILLAGDGPERPRVEQAIAQRKLQDSVILHPVVTPDEMPDIYRGSDLFLLPSLLDPNPLSTIEALKCGLPILVSNRIGNYPEALRIGVNGWGFDPYEPSQVDTAVTSAFSASADTLQAMGLESLKIAANNWDSETIVAQFLDQVL
ncbi:MAG: glycosyltransferase family 4 protein [Chloroflexi bacterium]|nr:glycosyltransferase family 4 protein [Chloroflexota bacterium]